MRPHALTALLLACVSLAQCGGTSSPPAAPTPLSPVPPTVPGPVSTFSLSGTVIDGWTQLRLPGVTVIATGPTAAIATTLADGSYAMTNLTPGLYSITLSKRLFRPRTYTAVAVFSDTTHAGQIGLEVGTPVMSDLSGLWVGHGPYRDEPLWLTLIDSGSSYEGMYRDRTFSSYSISGSRSGNAMLLRIDVGGGSILTVEGNLLHERCWRGVIKNEALGGNFPITFSRGDPPRFCDRF